jgi:hypothetical protein
MINPVFDFFEKLLEQFTWRRLIFVLILSFLAIASLVTYETYTGHFRLKRIEQSTNLLHKLTALSPEIKRSEDNASSDIFKALINDLDLFVNHRTTPFSVPIWLLKLLASVLPWILISTLFLVGDSKNSKNAVVGLLLAAIPCSVIGALLPNFTYQIFNYLIYPFTSTFIVMTAIKTWQKNKKKRP